MTPAWIGQPFTIVDGGLSTALEALGSPPVGRLWTAQLVIDRPEMIVQAHRRFVDAGAEVVITASYQASIEGFVRAGLDRARARAALASTTELARRAGAPFVAASIGPFGAALGDGSEYHGRYAAAWDEVRAYHRSRFEVLADTDCDLFAIETIPTEIEAGIVVDELARATSLPAWLSVTCAGSPAVEMASTDSPRWPRASRRSRRSGSTAPTLVTSTACCGDRRASRRCRWSPTRTAVAHGTPGAGAGWMPVPTT